MASNSFRQYEEKVRRLIYQFRDEAAVDGLTFFKDSFKNQGFTDRSLVRWEPRKKKSIYFKKSITERKKSGKSGKRSTFKLNHSAIKDNNRPILVGTERHVRLKNSLKKNVSGLNITYSSDKPYAQVHNEGGNAGRRRRSKIPPRPFMGESEVLTKNLTDKFHNIMSEAFNNLPNI